MAGTVTETAVTHTSVKKIKWDWLTDAAGQADATSVAVYNGEIIGVTTVPDGGGTQPTDLYDVTIKDSDGVDLLMGNGANRSNVNTEYITQANTLAAVDSQLVLQVLNGGNAKGGIVYVYIR